MLSSNKYNSPESMAPVTGHPKGGFSKLRRTISTGLHTQGWKSTQTFDPIKEGHIRDEAVDASSLYLQPNTDLKTTTSSVPHSVESKEVTDSLTLVLPSTNVNQLTGTSTRRVQEDPETNNLINLAIAVPIQKKPSALKRTLTRFSKMSLKRTRPSLRLKRPKSHITPLALLIPPDTPPSPESRLPQRVVGPINIAIVRYLANIPIHAKEKVEYSDSPTTSTPGEDHHNVNSDSDASPGTSPTIGDSGFQPISNLNRTHSRSSSISSITSVNPTDSLSTHILLHLSTSPTLPIYLQTLFSLYHSLICPSIRHHFTTLYTSWCTALTECEALDGDPTADYNVMQIEQEMEKLTDWAVPGMGNAFDLARKRFMSELDGGDGGKEEMRYFKHLVDRFAGLQGEGGEVLIRMAREKLVGRGWEGGGMM